MYDFDAGDLSLNFANTKDWHGSQNPVENLISFQDLVVCGERAGLVLPDQVTRLNQIAEEQPDKATHMYHFAIQLREALYRIFSRYIVGQPIPEADISLLNDVTCQAMSQLRLASTGKTFRWQLPNGLVYANLILWPVARAAAELLTSDTVAHVRLCEDDRGCGYLFIDQTKNHSRRWCSMESCGNRAKAKRHYNRIQSN